MSLNNPVGLAISLKSHWKMFAVEGVLLIVLGFLALLVPPLATLGVTLVLGWLFLLSGVIGLVTTFWARQLPGFGWSLISALLGIAAGLVLLMSPVTGALSLTLVLIVFFIIEGVVSIMYAINHRQQFSGRWGFMLMSGIVDLVLAAMVYAGLPASAAWALGVLVGINMVFGGTALVAMALHARSATAT
jgi:uncharacterized membrane protein HdeD (DUF308 family)